MAAVWVEVKHARLEGALDALRMVASMVRGGATAPMILRSAESQIETYQRLSASDPRQPVNLGSISRDQGER